MGEPAHGQASTVIAAPPEAVWALVTDVTCTGEWSAFEPVAFIGRSAVVDQAVVTNTAQDEVVPRLTGVDQDEVAVGTAQHDVVPPAYEDDVEVGTAPDVVVAVTGLDPVLPVAAVDAVVVGTAVDAVVSVAAGGLRWR